ncbi:unnamed protein product [Arctia plantaginis]|uniref:Putative inorganic phosphate cotransporter n=1 Tax=Arctia plantaginis TaxID=874455 RepID=A0A8S0YPZ8_ARCPL|nr:unnamed protein product [Arctia plantaginis]
MTDTPLPDVAPKPDRYIGMRHIIATLLFLATTVSYGTRVSMSVTIVAMTSSNSTSTNNFPVFDWNRSTQDMILSSFFWGYIVLQVPAGMIAGRFGAKYLLFFSMASTGIINLLLPLAATAQGSMAVVACRVGMGLTQGLLYPSLHGALGQWVPEEERSRLGTFVYSGAQFGTIVELLLSGVLSDSAWGWPSVFYVAGIACLGWSILWLLIGDSTPGTSRWITKEERKYIETNAGSSELGHGSMPTPWLSILTSLPFWAILLAHCGQNLGFWTLLSEMPSYMNHVLNVNIKENGNLSSLPYIAMLILSFIFSWIADFLVNRRIISLVTSRRIFNSIALWGPAVALIGLSYLPPGHLTLAVVLLTVTVGLNGAHYSGFMMSHIDLSPNYASTMMGLTNGAGAIFSLLAPFTVSIFVSDETQASEWRKVFFISASFYFLTNLFYVLFITADIQSWNEPKHSEPIEDGVKKEKSVKEPKRKKINVTTSVNGEAKF